MAEQKKIEIVAEIRTSLSGMDKAIDKLERGLQNQKFDLSKNSGIAKLIKQYKEAKQEFDALSMDGFIDPSDLKKANQASAKISKIYRQIYQTFQKMQGSDKDALRELFPKKFSTQVDKGTKAINSFFSSLSRKQNQETGLANAEKDLERLNTQLTNLKAQRIKIEVDADISDAEKKIDDLKKKRSALVEDFKKRITPTDVRDESGKIYDEDLIKKDIEQKKKSYERKQAEATGLKKRELTQIEKNEIKELKEQYEGNEFKHQEKVAKEVLKKYQAEATVRAVASETGAPDKGRSRRAFGKLDDDELNNRIAEAEDQIKDLEKKKAQVKKQIEDIEARPAAEFQAEKKKRETAQKAAKTKLETAEKELETYQKLKREQEEAAKTQAESFSSGEEIGLSTVQEREELKKLDDAIEETSQNIKKLKSEKTFSSQEEKDDRISGKQGEIRNKELSIKEFERRIKDLTEQTDISKVFEKLEELNINTFGIDKTEEGLKKIKENLNSLDENTINSIKVALREMGIEGEDAENAIKTLAHGLDLINTKDEDLRRTAQEIENLKDQVKYFFSLSNAIDIFKNTVRDSVETVKELDAVMTETAVVTDFTISDMWEKLPEYAAQASNLGASIRELYSATTLYYQQGLNSVQAMDVGIETMKMARIANMDAAQATEAMTAALRGFNMEINEVSATRVNDVYSELAAITAADTNQIATAMGKTASIAASANMEFETTAALLAQIIETTQEAPETAGTAMKTIIARFTEVKELFDEGMLTGEDEEGEEIDINKIDTALKKVGISLKDFLNGSKGIDDIFLELASKWDSLDLATQRYIATTAAGSRQQSRFLAMMSNYDRTMELVTAANNSAGASQEQYEKTLESLEAKLQQLKNAWDQFVMGLANDELIKGGVDVLTWVLETINKIIDLIGGGNGLSKSIITLMTVIGALKGGGAIFNKIFSSEKIKEFIETMRRLPREAKTAGTQTGQNLRNGIKTALEGTITDANQAGFKAGQAYQQGWEGGWIEDPFDKPSQFGEPIKEENKKPKPETVPKQQTPTKKSQSLGTFKEEWKNTSEYGMQLTGVLTALAGTGLNWASTAVKAGNETSVFGAALQGAGSAATAAGSGISLLAPFLVKTGVTLGKLIPAVAIAVVAIGALSAAFQLVRNNSPEGKLEAAEKAAKKAGEAAESAAESYELLNSSLGAISQKGSSLKKLAKHTNEWKKATQELNSEVLNLVEKYPELATFVDSSEGYLQFKTGEINGKTVDDILNTYEENQYKTQSAEAAANIQKQQAQADVDFKNLDKAAKIYDQVMEANDEIPQAIANREETNKLARRIATGDIFIPKDSTDPSQGAQIDPIFDYLGGEGSEAWEALQKYGQELLASDAAIEVFTDALLSNALMITDVTDEQKDNMMNFLNSDQIDALYEKEKDKINWTFNREQRIKDKQEYADIMGYKYDSGKNRFFKDGQQVEVTNDEVKSQLAAIRTQENLAENMKVLNKLFESGNGGSITELLKAFTEKPEGEALTWDQINTLQGYLDKKDDGNGILQTYFKNQNLDEIYGDYDTFIDFLTKGMELAEERKVKIQERQDALGMKDMFKDMSIDTGTASNILDNLYQVMLESGWQSMSNLWRSLGEGLTGEEAQKFADALGMIDWSNVDSIEQLSEYLTELDFTELSPERIEEIEKQIISAMNAVREFNLEKIKEELKSTQDLIDDISGREETERTYTEEERDALIKANPALASDFVMNGIDEFVYVGESNEALVEALNNNTSALLKEQGKQLKGAAEKSAKWETLLEDDAAGYNVLKEIASADSIQKGAALVKDQSREDLISLMQSAGVGENLSLGAKFTSGDKKGQYVYSDDFLYDLIKKEYGTYGTAQAQADNKEAYGSFFQLTPQVYYSSMSGQEILNSTDVYKNEQGNALTEDQDQIARAAALNAKLVQQEGGMTEASSTYETLQKENGEWEKHENLVKAAIVDAASYEKKLGKLADTIEDNADALVDSKKGTREYEKALDKVTDAVQDAFGDNITKEFVEENLDLFKEFAKGSEGSADDIREAMLQTYEGMEIFDDIQKAVEGLDGLNFDIYGHANADQIFSELADVLEGADAAAEAIRQLGYSVNWEPDGTTTMLMPDGSTRQIPNYRTVITDTAGNVEAARRSGGGGGGGGGGKDWENPYDKLYNITENINRTLREREKLERRYQVLLDKRFTTAEALRKSSLAELASLKEQAVYQNLMIRGREEMLREHLAENEELSEYGTYDFENQVVVIDWEKIDAIKDTEEGEKIENYISKLEELRDSLQDAEDGLDDIEDQVQEINERGKDEYFELEERIKEAIVETRQKEIDTMEEINNSINNTNSKLLDAIRQSIDKIRQDRENARTEEELQEKQRQLAYLQQDTSGANDMAILALQEEIRQGQEDYTDTLIDQKISELQQQNDEAAEQREQQIAILQSQLDHYIESGDIWHDVYELMGNGLDKENGLIRGSKLEQILKDSESWSGMSTLGQMTWLEELEDMAAQAVNYLKLGRQLENLEMSGQTIEFTTADGKTLSGTVDEDGNVTVDGYTYEDIYQNWDGSYFTDENYQEPKDQDSIAPETPETSEIPKEQEKKTYWKADYSVEGTNQTVWGYQSKSDAEKAARNAIYSYFKKEGYVGGSLEEAAGWAYQTIKAQMYKYKTGGLADYTGPAWLDGTKSKPELVLNARDTENFIQLKDILSSIMSHNFSNNSASTENNGDITYDIDINVESIGNDYDVEQVANKVKSLIGEDARYRNNNAVSLKR